MNDKYLAPCFCQLLYFVIYTCSVRLIVKGVITYCRTLNSLPTAEETGVGEKSTEETNKRVTEALRHEKGKRKRKGTAHLEETKAKIGKFAAVNGKSSDRPFLKSH